MTAATTNNTSGPQATPAKWSSQFAFLMAAVGAAVGLGNLWRFPFQVGQNGGSAFVFIYLLCIVLIATPILIAEVSVGRRKRLSVVGSFRELAKDVGATPWWGVIGFVAIAADLLVLSTYSAIAGQIMSFSAMSFMGVFANGTADAGLPLFSGPVLPAVWFSLFLGITMIVVAAGLRAGVERMVTILMPLFFVLLAGLSVYALTSGAAEEALAYLFAPRFSELSGQVFLAAMGQAFYSVAVGAGAMVTYGAYLDRKESIAANAGLIAGADTIVAIVAGLMIFPIVFAFGLNPGAGMGLIFEALPKTFAGMPAGSVIGGLFFFLAFIAALTSSIAMLLIPAVFFEEWLGWSRLKTVLLLGGGAWLLGMVGLNVDHMAEAIDFLAGNVFLPVAGGLGAVFVGWVVPRAIMRDELSDASDGVFRLWRFLVRWLCPAAVGAILVFGLIASAGQ